MSSSPNWVGRSVLCGDAGESVIACGGVGRLSHARRKQPSNRSLRLSGMSTTASLAFALLAVTSTLAQSPRPARVEFEVAVIRPTATAARAIRIDGAQVHFTGFLLREYIAR